VGRLVWQGRLADLRAQREPCIVVESSTPQQAADVLAAEGLADVAVSDGHVRAKLGAAEPERIVAALVHGGVGVRAFGVEQPSLEEQFVGLTGEGFDVSG
jgi:ABC-type uncharacterized transport system ATPase subunit